MKKVVILAWMFFLLFAVAGSSDAALLGTYNTSMAGGSNVATSQVNFSLNGFFTDLVLTSSSAGNSYSVDLASPAYDVVNGLLTNGIANNYSYSVIFPSAGGFGSGITDAQLTGGNGVDFQGYDLATFEMVVNSITINSPGQNPNGDGRWTDFQANMNFNVYSVEAGQEEGGNEGGAPVPEPATLFIFGSGILGLFLRRKV
jgi:hypothetical protein